MSRNTDGRPPAQEGSWNCFSRRVGYRAHGPLPSAELLSTTIRYVGGKEAFCVVTKLFAKSRSVRTATRAEICSPESSRFAAESFPLRCGARSPSSNVDFNSRAALMLGVSSRVYSSRVISKNDRNRDGEKSHIDSTRTAPVERMESAANCSPVCCFQMICGAQQNDSVESCGLRQAIDVVINYDL